MAHEFRLLGVDDDTAVRAVDVIAENRQAAGVFALALGGGYLVQDALAYYLALELGE